MAKAVKSWCLGALLCASVSVVGVAQADPGEDAIEYRQAIFTAFKWNFGTMGAMIRGKMDYDAAEFERRATQLAALAPMAAQGFIEGSELGDTAALPELWENMDDVNARFDELVERTAALAEVAGGEMDDAKAAFGAVGKSCKGCHDNYKED